MKTTVAKRISPLILAIAGVSVFAALLNFGLGAKFGMSRPLESDGYYFFQLARSLAQGEGYVIRDGFWPETASMRRLPGWPAVAGVAMAALPNVDAACVMRALALAINAAVASALVLLTWLVFRRVWCGVMAGLLYAIHPTGLACAVEGLSEPLFILLLVLGLAALTVSLSPVLASERGEGAGGKSVAVCVLGFLLMGFAVLVRANFALWVIFLGAILGVAMLRRRVPLRLRTVSVLVCGALVCAAPAVTWAVRNHRVCGHFPVLSTLRGQTFYGGNNALVAESRQYWGYWVFPNLIPGETPMWQLSRTMSEYEVDDYYYSQGKAFLSAHPGAIPRLLLGKLVRAYIPVPWRIQPASVALAGFRMGLYVLIAIGCVTGWRRTPTAFRYAVLAMLATNVATVLIFYGYTRFAFALEPLLTPLAAYGALACIAGMRSRWLSRSTDEVSIEVDASAA